MTIRHHIHAVPIIHESYEECIGSRQQMYDIFNVEKIK